MLGFFPRPGDDELLYSVVARYGVLAGQDVGSKLIEAVFGTTVGIAAVDLPRRLGGFIGRMPPGTSLTVDSVIGGHTVFPYLLAFAPPETARRVRETMAGENRCPPRLGVLANAFPTPPRLMLCRRCAREDAVGFGVATWRRVHQLPGARVCPRHGTPIAESSAARVHRRGRSAFAAATHEVVAAAKEVKVPRRAEATMLKFACATDRLLGTSPGLLAGADLQRRLRNLLRDFRWSRAPSLLHTSALIDALTSHPSIRIMLDVLNLSLSAEQWATALNRLLYKDRVSKHPLFILMLLELVGATLDDLMQLEVPQATPTESVTRLVRIRRQVRHDLPCGNPVCPRYQGTPAPLLRKGWPTNASLEAYCRECGFAYAWGGTRPGTTAVTATGTVWDWLLLEKLTAGLSLRAVGRAVSASTTTVMRHARRLGYWREEWKDRPKVQLRRDTVEERLIAWHRAIWLDIWSTGISCPAKKLPKPAFNAYRYLMRKDRDWIQRNYPLTRKVSAFKAVGTGTTKQAIAATFETSEMQDDGLACPE